MENYRCYRCYIPATASERTAETVSFFPHATPLPKTISIDVVIIAANDRTYALTHPCPASPTMILGNERERAL